MGNKDRFRHIQASPSIKTGAITDGGLIDAHLEGEPDVAFLDEVASAAAYPAFVSEIHVSHDESGGSAYRSPGSVSLSTHRFETRRHQV